jgi:hypothetical protein
MRNAEILFSWAAKTSVQYKKTEQNSGASTNTNVAQLYNEQRGLNALLLKAVVRTRWAHRTPSGLSYLLGFRIILH